jgi:hypothetical protein
MSYRSNPAILNTLDLSPSPGPLRCTTTRISRVSFCPGPEGFQDVVVQPLSW